MTECRPLEVQDVFNALAACPMGSPASTRKKKNDYYKGGYRVIIHGVPCKIFLPPSENMLELMRTEGYSVYGKGSVKAKTRTLLRYPSVQYDLLAWLRTARELTGGPDDAGLVKLAQKKPRGRRRASVPPATEL